ncbi:MAG: DUF502 domain-containing protein [Candidatus Omnitrophota bacterium]
MKAKIRNYFITGLVVLLPIVITLNILFISIKFVDNILGRYINPLLERNFGISIFGLGFLAVIILIFITGVLTANVFIKRVLPFVERVFLRFPLVSQIYPSIKQLVKFLFSKEKVAFKKVVLFEYPRKGVYTLGFVTNEFYSESAKGAESDIVCVYISSAPNPITGFFVMLPKNDVIFLDISIEEAFKMIVSGGVLMQNDFLKNKLNFEEINKGAGVSHKVKP